MRAVTVLEAAGDRRLGIERHDPPSPALGEVTVAVRAISLDNGEIREALAAPAGHRPGWDFAGVVEAVPDGSDVAVGDRDAKSCAVLNIEGFYDKLLGFLDHVVDEAFLKPVHRGMLLASSDPSALLDLIGSCKVPSEAKWISSDERGRLGQTTHSLKSIRTLRALPRPGRNKKAI